jgi:hypothetical protein
LRPVERLDLTLLIDGQDHGMDRRRDVKADDIVKLLGKSLVIRQFEAAPAMWRTSMLMPEILTTEEAAIPTAFAIARTVRCVASCRDASSERAATLNEFAVKRRDARRSALVAPEAVHTFRHKPLLPAPDAGLGFAGRLHDGNRSQANATHQNDLRPQRMLLRRTAGGNDCQ